MFTANVFSDGLQCCRWPNVMGFFFFFFFFSRTSDGGKTVGTIEVNLVKMGELEDGEAEHITTDGQDQKVDTQIIAWS